MAQTSCHKPQSLQLEEEFLNFAENLASSLLMGLADADTKRCMPQMAPSLVSSSQHGALSALAWRFPCYRHRLHNPPAHVRTAPEVHAAQEALLVCGDFVVHLKHDALEEPVMDPGPNLYAGAVWP